jgi:hypothetical protein
LGNWTDAQPHPTHHYGVPIRDGAKEPYPEDGEQIVKALFIAQHGQEESDAFHERVNGELERLGSRVKDIQMGTCLHEKSLGGRISIPMIIFSVMVLYEESE